MQTNQVSIFSMLDEKVSGGSKVQDIRTEGQLNRSISYDVGEKIGGARKDIAKEREAFLTKPTVSLLDELEEHDVSVAAAVIIRDTFFKWFSFDDCQKRGVEPGVAKAIQLFINRIPKESADSRIERRKYTNTMLFISELLQAVKTREDFYSFEKRMKNFLTADWDENSEVLHLKAIQGPFRTYFTNHQSRVSTLRRAFAIEEWDDLMAAETNKGGVRKSGGRKPAWERILPEEPKRNGNITIRLENPKEYVEYFGFRASEFGHYMDDAKGKEHLSRSAEAFADLAAVLELPNQALSLKGELAMAFGSRGRGRALGHYEPARKVINLTKEKGSLGILAHEWFHAMDHYLYNESFNNENGKLGYITDLTYGQVSSRITSTLSELIEAMKIGNATAYIDVADCKNRYNIKQGFVNLYKDVGGDLLRFMDFRLIDYDERLEDMLGYYRNRRTTETDEVKLKRKRDAFIKNSAEALAQLHYEQTGIVLEKVPYPTVHSEFYQNAINLDKGKIGKYWSSNVELAARAFEFYVMEKLKHRNWTSDYLVCGIGDKAYPQNEREGDRIFYFMSQFIEAVRPVLKGESIF